MVEFVYRPFNGSHSVSQVVGSATMHIDDGSDNMYIGVTNIGRLEVQGPQTGIGLTVQVLSDRG